ncbi:MAG: GAF domain-containing protein [Cyanobacteria bacterium J06598_3]
MVPPVQQTRQCLEQSPPSSSQDALLSGVAEAAKRLLAIADLDVAISGALEAIALAAGIDRIFIYENRFDLALNEEVADCPYEWTAPKNSPWEKQDRFPMVYSQTEGFTEWLRALKAGNPVQMLTRDLSAGGQAIHQQDQALSTLTVPLFIEGSYWGNLGFDDCTTERVWSKAEIAVLETAAACIGSAIERTRTQKARQLAEQTVLIEREAAAQVRAQELETYNQQLRDRDSLLKCVNAAAQCLVANDDLSVALPAMLKILGEGTQQCRAYILRNVRDDHTGELIFNLELEWDAPNIPTKMESGAQFPVPVSHFPAHLSAPLKVGNATQFFARELDGISPDDRPPGQARSLMGVPITMDGQWWGLLGLDDCLDERLWSEAEITVLKTAATAVGSALERDQNRQAREMAEREILIAQERAAKAAELEAANRVLRARDRWLETTAVVANELLSATDIDASVATALQTIGENLDCDRVYVMQRMTTPHESGNDVEFARLTYEWHASGIESHIDKPEIRDISGKDFKAAAEQLTSGAWFGGLISELDEPERSRHQALGEKSSYIIPVFIEREIWGTVGIVHCRQAKRLNSAEIAAFKTAATCVGSAIYQAQVRRDRQQAERNFLLEQGREQAAQARAAQLQESNEILSLRDRWLEVTAAGANRLLAANLETSIAPTMKVLGEGTQADRVGIMRAIQRDGELFYEMYAEWTSGEQPSQTDDSQMQEIPAAILGDFINERLLSGRWVGGDLNNADIFPEALQAGLKSLGIQTSYSVPIFTGDRFWGVIGLDYCGHKRLLTSSEMAVFRTVANCFGSAIERDHINKTREAVERRALIDRERAARAVELEAANAVLTRRDRWLETTAAAANQLLSNDNVESSVKAALQTIGENLECDRVVVLQYITQPDAPAHVLGFMRLLYEWGATGIKPQGDYTGFYNIPSDGIEHWFRQLIAGEWVGGLTQEASEPFRSIQQALDVKTGYAMPVMVEGVLWGAVCIDYCREVEPLEAAEIAVFRTAATCVASAIYQAQVRRDQAAQERAKLLSSVAEAANLLLRSADYTTVLSDVVQLLGEAVGSDRCSITQDVRHPRSGKLAIKLLAEWCADRRLPATPDAPVFFDEDNCLTLSGDFLVFHRALCRGEVINFLVGDLTTAPEKKLMESQGNTSMLIVPIMVQGQRWGGIGFDNCGEPQLYDESEISILRVAAESIASAIARQVQDEALRDVEKAVLEEREKAAQRRASELARINESISTTLTALAANPELDQFLGSTLAEVAQQVGAYSVHMFLFDSLANTLNLSLVVEAGEIYIGTGPNDPAFFKQPIPADHTPAWASAMGSGQPLNYDENTPYDDTIWWPEAIVWHQGQGHKAVTCIPMLAGKQPVGFLGIAFRDRTVLSPAQIEFMQALVNQAIIAIQLTRLAEQNQTAALSAALNNERTRLAREIHDTLAQSFTGVSLQLEAVRGLTCKLTQGNAPITSLEDAQTYILRARDLARQGLSEARRSVHALRSEALETDTLTDALRKILDQTTRDTGLKTRFHLGGEAHLLPDDLQLNLLRIAQEAVTNVLRHAQATELSLALTFSAHQICLQAIDDGIGFDVLSLTDIGGFGLVGIRERSARFGGRVNIFSRPHQGTTLEVVLPFRAHPISNA